MNKIIILFFCFLTTTSVFSQSGWTAINLPPNFEQVSFLNSNTGWAVVRKSKPTKDTLYKTTNGGLNWYSISSVYSLMIPLDYHNPYSFPTSNTGYITAMFSQPDEYKIHKTTDGGLHWTALCLASTTNPGIMFLNANTGYKTVVTTYPYTFYNLYRTTNGGTNWSSVYTGRLGIIQFLSSSTGYLASENFLTKTLNGGANWTIIKDFGGGYSIKSISFADDLTGWVLYRDTIFRTTNGGFNWNKCTSAPTGKNSCWFVNASTGWVCGNAGMVFNTTNGGTTWSFQNSNTLTHLTRIKFFSENTGYIWGYFLQGVLLKTTTGGSIGINKISGEVPTDYYLAQNYPNPFNSSTNIRFDIPKLSFVRISIYDISGKEIFVLVNTQLLPGSYQADWDASGFSSGVYFYKITADTYFKTKKMLLIK